MSPGSLSGIDVVQLHQRIIAFDARALRRQSRRRSAGRLWRSLRRWIFVEYASAAPRRALPDLIPPFRPAASCWCARTIVESMACSLSPGGLRSSRQGFRMPRPTLCNRHRRCEAGPEFNCRILLQHVESAPGLSSVHIAENRSPLTVAPWRAGAQNPENAIDHPLVLRSADRGRRRSRESKGSRGNVPIPEVY